MSAAVSSTVAQAERHVPSPGPGVRGFVRRAFEEAFQPDRVFATVDRTFAQLMDENGVANDFDTPVNRRMAELEQAAYTPEGVRLFREYAAKLESAMPPAERLERLQRLEQARGQAHASIERRIGILRAVLQAFNQATSEEHRMNDGKIDEVLEGIRDSLQVSTQNYSLVSLLFTYRSATDAELDQYISFWESEQGRRLNRLTEQALSAGMEHGIETAMENLSRSMDQSTTVTMLERDGTRRK